MLLPTHNGTAIANIDWLCKTNPAMKFRTLLTRSTCAFFLLTRGACHHPLEKVLTLQHRVTVVVRKYGAIDLGMDCQELEGCVAAEDVPTERSVRLLGVGVDVRAGREEKLDHLDADRVFQVHGSVHRAPCTIRSDVVADIVEVRDVGRRRARDVENAAARDVRIHLDDFEQEADCFEVSTRDGCHEDGVSPCVGDGHVSPALVHRLENTGVSLESDVDQGMLATRSHGKKRVGSQLEKSQCSIVAPRSDGDGEHARAIEGALRGESVDVGPVLVHQQVDLAGRVAVAAKRNVSKQPVAELDREDRRCLVQVHPGDPRVQKPLPDTVLQGPAGLHHGSVHELVKLPADTSLLVNPGCHLTGRWKVLLARFSDCVLCYEEICSPASYTLYS